jgi:hypothetical protein
MKEESQRVKRLSTSSASSVIGNNLNAVNIYRSSFGQTVCKHNVIKPITEKMTSGLIINS